ncbi:hypothetical protein H9Q72_001820 [Fusarium xylarioides]|uniref:Nucleoside phosphorylase domain-containing protein n=1 Tax=Fusarium xylarioides TaxID=221167 RepID=A0A9P7I212_9HYPO|nr:hypothetical protein H9Q72_001820 [Fusarium xylarioides]
MERRRLSHSDDDALPYHAKRRTTGFQQIENESIRERYTVAWICALHIEMAAARAMLDEEHADCPRQANDSNSYVLGSMKNHNVVIACLPTHQYGTNNAASVLSNMRRTFPNIEIGLMVGIGGGVPLNADIRLGDIVVGIRVMQYDMGKTLRGGFQRTGIPKIPDSTIRTVISNLRSRHELTGSRVPSILREKMESYAAYSRPSEPDRLFQQSYHHPPSSSSCGECDSSRLETRKMRSSTDPAIYYGGIGSANTVMKDSSIRDQIARDLDVLCFEMEAAGLMDIMPCLPIRGICDYSDSHKSKEWQRYAAATAAAYAYEFLELWRGDSQASYPGGHHPQSEHTMTSGRHEAILKFLNFEEIDARKSNIKAAHTKTCRWFLKHPDYISWTGSQQMPQHHGFIWIRGKPGAGKSTIMKFIYLQSKRQDREHQSLTTSFFFNARGELLERTVSGMYRSLLLQLFQGFPDLECVLNDPELLPQSQSGCPSLNVLKELFRAAVMRLAQRSFTCFIDALDECDEQQVMDLVEYLEELAEQCSEDNVDLRICFSSRHYPYIDIRFGIRIILEDQIGHASDLENYITTHLRIKSRRLLQELQEKMLDKAAGVFLWVVLVVNILNQESRRGGLALKRRLNEVPSGLSDLFKDLLKRDTTKMEEFQLSIFWILLGERPLKPEEYYHAIWSGLHLEGIADFDIPEVDTEDSENCFDRCVISTSKGLAEIAKDRQPRVQFIHESVRDFLIKDKGLHELWPELGPDWESVGHEKLKLCCYSYFGLVTKRIPDSYPLDEIVTSDQSEVLIAHKPSLVDKELILDTDRYPFLEYASQSVLNHADLASNINDQQSFLESFPFSVWKGVVNLFGKHQVWKYSPGAGPLYIFVDRGHSSLIQTRLKIDSNIYAPSMIDRYIYPLTAAMAKGDKSSVIALLGLTSGLYDGIDITERLVSKKNAGAASLTPLFWACENGYLGIARILVERDAQPADTGEEGHSPLLLASKNGHTDIARWLINHRNNIAVWLAASNGHVETVEFLLNAGADPDTCGVNDEPLLCLAVEKRNEELVKILLRGGANVEATNRRTETPLHLAARKQGSVAIMEALLSYGADVNMRDRWGQTPFMLAARCASIDEIGCLIRRGADLAAQGTCLHEAICRGETALEVVRFLLENGARADARNESGQTCLHAFASQGTVVPSTSDLIQLATSHGTEINASDTAGNTPLHFMTKYGALVAFSSFTDLPGLDLNARNHLGRTPMHVAASHPLPGTGRLALLIAKGADINSLDDQSRTPLDDAIETGYEEAIELLMDIGGKRGVTKFFHE